MVDKTDTNQYYYRYDGISYAPPADEYGDPGRGPGSQSLHLQKYKVLKHTPKGVWLQIGTYFDEDAWEKTREQVLKEKKRFVLHSARKRFACPTEELALESFIERKKRQASIYRARAYEADGFIDLANRKLRAKGKNTVDHLLDS
jgi:hypothetical protein